MCIRDRVIPAVKGAAIDRLGVNVAIKQITVAKSVFIDFLGDRTADSLYPKEQAVRRSIKGKPSCRATAVEMMDDADLWFLLSLSRGSKDGDK